MDKLTHDTAIRSRVVEASKWAGRAISKILEDWRAEIGDCIDKANSSILSEALLDLGMGIDGPGAELVGCLINAEKELPSEAAISGEVSGDDAPTRAGLDPNDAFDMARARAEETL